MYRRLPFIIPLLILPLILSGCQGMTRKQSPAAVQNKVIILPAISDSNQGKLFSLSLKFPPENQAINGFALKGILKSDHGIITNRSGSVRLKETFDNNSWRFPVNKITPTEGGLMIELIGTYMAVGGHPTDSSGNIPLFDLDLSAENINQLTFRLDPQLSKFTTQNGSDMYYANSSESIKVQVL